MEQFIAIIIISCFSEDGVVEVGSNCCKVVGKFVKNLCCALVQSDTPPIHPPLTDLVRSVSRRCRIEASSLLPVRESAHKNFIYYLYYNKQHQTSPPKKKKKKNHADSGYL